MSWDSGRPTHVPPEVRRAVLDRDQHRCTATLTDGTRCRVTQDSKLQIHHLLRYGAGGPTTAENLVTLCHWHHNRETQREATETRSKTRAALRAGPDHGKHPGLS